MNTKAYISPRIALHTVEEQRVIAASINGGSGGHLDLDTDDIITDSEGIGTKEEHLWSSPFQE